MEQWIDIRRSFNQMFFTAIKRNTLNTVFLLFRMHMCANAKHRKIINSSYFKKTSKDHLDYTIELNYTKSCRAFKTINLQIFLRMGYKLLTFVMLFSPSKYKLNWK